MLNPTRRALLDARPNTILTKPSAIHPTWLKRTYASGFPRGKVYREPGANFPIGQKKVYLPDFTVSLLRTPTLPATHAQFRVPLDFTKLDLRDYLFHAYNVRVHSVTSRIQGPKISPKLRNPDPSALRKKPLNSRQRTLQRRIEGWLKDEKIQKRMTVHLETPFVWPPKPSEEEMRRLAGPQADLRERKRAQQKQRQRTKRLGTRGRTHLQSLVRQDANGYETVEDTMRAHRFADRLLRGKVTWGSPQQSERPQLQRVEQVELPDAPDGTGAKAARLGWNVRKQGKGGPVYTLKKTSNAGTVTWKGQSLGATFSAARRKRPDF